ncbi:MAG: spermidine/putrescine ABC transporter substrate-binding protein [Ruminococcaceae bacterium]|nr:spermidine/putrescine ABC transporter substrate-binding protein [Oscillospiraceae bacterium]
MSLKKILLLILMLSLITLTFISCKENEDGDDTRNSSGAITLNVYNWGEYISDGSFDSLDVNKAFEEYYFKKYGKRLVVNYTTYATNEDMYSKLKNSAVVYDIVVPSDYMIEKMISEDMLLAFDVNADIENYGNIDDAFKGLYYDPDSRYSVPYTYGMVGIIYNTNLVDPEDYENQSWDLLWNPKYSGKILQFNNPRDAFGSAMYYKGIDINSTNPADWEYALEILKLQKPLVQGYVNDEIFNKMTTASAAVAPYFAGDFIIMADQEEALDFYYPKEGTNYFVDAMCIPKNAAHPDIAKEYINFMLTEEPAVANAIAVGYSSPNLLVQNSDIYFEEMGESAIEILYGASPDIINAEYNKKYGTACYKSFTAEMQEHVNMLWESLKTENATELWIHITSIVIVVAVTGFGIYTIYIRKLRSRHYRVRDKQKRITK